MMSLEVGDKSGNIDCTVFGDMAERLSGTLSEDQIYEIKDGYVNENTYLGKSSLRLTINEKTRLDLKEDDPRIPYLEDTCCTVKELLAMPVGEEPRVICLVRDSGEIQNITSREGKQLRLKKIMLCDPEERVEVEVSIWNEKCEEQFPQFPCVIKGLQVGEYRGNKNFSLRKNHQIRVLKQHHYRKYIKDLDGMSFDHPLGQQQSGQTTLSNFL